MDTSQSIKYSKILAKNETSSRKQIEYLNLLEGKIGIEESAKSLYQFNVSYSTIFDGLAFACTHFYNHTWEDKTGVSHDIIGRKDDETETHYRLFAPESFIKEIFTGAFAKDWPKVKNQLLKLTYKPQYKKLIINQSHYIIDAPIKVIPWYENDDIQKFINLSPRRKGKTDEARNKLPRETGKAKGKIIGFSIEFFKPLFKPLLELSQKKVKTPGSNYILTPPYFQLKLNSMFKDSKEKIQNSMSERQKIFDVRAIESGLSKREKEHMLIKAKIFEKRIIKNLEKVTPLDVRKFYLALALKDNHIGKYITIDDFVEFIDGIWPELIRTGKNGIKTLPPAKFDESIEKIKTILNVYFLMMAKRGDMDGGQILPLAITSKFETTREQFNSDTTKLRIQCIKKKTLFSKYGVDEIIQHIGEFISLDKNRGSGIEKRRNRN